MTRAGPHVDLDDLRRRIGPLDAAAMEEARRRWANRAKPPGSLGRLEDVAVLIAGVTGRCPPSVPVRPTVTVFAGDHGSVADGASAWPSEITALMVATMASGGAAINALAATVGATVTVVDVGVAGDIPTPPGTTHGVVDARIRPGTASIAHGSAMTRDEAVAAIGVGAVAAADAVAGGADLLVGGDMGIGNTTASAALVAWATGARPEVAVGPGAGVPDGGLGRKAQIVAAALDRITRTDDPVTVLAGIGGLEIAALVGWHLGAAAARVPVLADGVIGLAALCVAEAVAPGTASRTIAGHRSTEPAASIALDHLGLRPLLDLGLHLGEGTGACLAVPVVQAAARALNDMAPLPE